MPNVRYRVSLVGSLNSGTEQFVTSFWAILPSGSTVGNPTATAVANAIAGQLKVAGAMTNTLKMINTNDSYDSVVVYGYPDYSATRATDTGQAALGLTGTGSSLNALQTAIVISLRSGIPGRSQRGRMYLPAKSAILTNTGFLSTPTAQSLATEWASIFHGVYVSPQGIAPVIYSKVRSQAVGITQIIVDSRPDVQRRRAGRQGTGTKGQAPVANS